MVRGLIVAAGLLFTTGALSAEIASVTATPIARGRTVVTVTVRADGPQDTGATWTVYDKRRGYRCWGMFGKGITKRVGPGLYRTSRRCDGVPSSVKSLRAEATWMGRRVRQGQTTLRLR